MDQGQIDNLVASASVLIEDENSRNPTLQNRAAEPGGQSGSKKVSLQDLESLRKRHVFLNEYPDAMLLSFPLETLIKLESTSIKLKSLDKARATEEKLANNRDNLLVNEVLVRETAWIIGLQNFTRRGFYLAWRVQRSRCGRWGGVF